jgi:hypothetical protein
MMVNDLDLIEKQLKYNFYKSIEDLSKKRVERCKFKVGQMVEVTWISRDYGTEKEIGYIYYIAPRKDGYLGYTYHFKKIKKRDGEMSHHGIDIPKYSKIIKLKNYVNPNNIIYAQ